jgi:hypothetical protein
MGEAPPADERSEKAISDETVSLRIRFGFRDSMRVEDRNNRSSLHAQIARTLISKNRVVQRFMS